MCTNLTAKLANRNNMPFVEVDLKPRIEVLIISGPALRYSPAGTRTRLMRGLPLQSGLWAQARMATRLRIVGSLLCEMTT